MVVQPTIDTAKRYSRQRLAPMIEESPRLRERVKDNRSRDEANTTLLKEFPGGFLAVAGANSAAGLRSMPVRDLFTDEEDAYPIDVDGEGDPVQLARARQTTFARRKHLRTSTPTTEGFSRIESAYRDTDRCRFHVPCPHCAELQPLEWGADHAHGLKWKRGADDKPLSETAHYVCRGCGGEIPEHHKPGMLAGGRWVPDNPAAPARKRGFHLSSLYSPLGWLSWAELVREWTQAVAALRSGDRSLMRVFVNTRLAQTWRDDGDGGDEHALRQRAGDDALGVVRWGLYVCTQGVDVQGDRLEVYTWAWGRGMERQLVDRRVIYGDPALGEADQGSPWAALTEYRRAPILHASGRPVPLLGAAIDSGGHHTHAVYAYARAHQHAGVIAVKGMSQPGRAVIGKPTDQDVNWKGARMKRGVKLWPVGADTAKEEIYSRLRTAEPGPGYVHMSKRLPGEVFEQITAERLVTRYVKGHARREWVKLPGRRNEALDCAVYALAAAYKAGIDRWREGEWRRWQLQAEPPVRDLFDSAAAPAEDGAPPAPEPAVATPPPPPPPETPQPPRRRVGRIANRGWSPL
jgi:phage terminase large subunit GpA-like protein